MILHDKVAEQLPAWRERVKTLVKEHGETIVDQVNIGQVYGGMRDIKSMVTDISFVDPANGIRFRGMTIPEVLTKLPKPRGAKIPYVGGLYYLLMTVKFRRKPRPKKWRRNGPAGRLFPIMSTRCYERCPRKPIPWYCFRRQSWRWKAVRSSPRHTMPASRRMPIGNQPWKTALDLTAKLPVIAAFIYRLKYFGETKKPKYNPRQDYGTNFARMMGVSDRKGYAELSRLYFILHSDHESGNVSAHATHLVGSALSDAYYAFSAGLNGLAGPLHGLANQECLGWLIDVRDKFGGVPSREDLYKFAWDTLNSGKVIPGYGHAVLRVPDPRYTAQLEFAKARFPDDTLLRLAELVFDVVPTVLKEQGKAKNPAPNVDAISGTLQYYYGVREFDFYTVLFGVGRALGVTPNLVWARALGQPIERPKSLSTAMLEEAARK